MINKHIRVLLLKYKAGTLTEAEKQALDEWYETSTEEEIWKTLADEQATGVALFSRITQQIEAAERLNQRMVSTRQTDWLRYAGRIAAGVILAVGIVYGWYTVVYQGHPHTKIVYKEIVNPAGTRATITLADGSKIRLNAASKLKYPVPFEGAQRQVYLEGEAFFEVKKDPDRPFIVHTGLLQTQVLGTSFNVKAYPEAAQQEVTVISGKVAVSAPQEEAIPLTPNQSLTYHVSQQKFTVAHMHQAADAYAWTTGQLVFDQTSLTEAFDMIERYYSVEIQSNAEHYETCRITARFANAPLSEVLQTLKISLAIDYTQGGSTIYIKGGDCM